MNILVTGVTAGFGKAIAELLVLKGHTVIGTGRRQAKLDKLKAQLGERFIGLGFDIADLAATKAALASLPNEIASHIDVLVNNAGLALGLESAEKADFADWQTMIEVNVIGLTHLTHAVLPSMVANGAGMIINLGSIAGSYPYPGGNVYGATKAFVKQFSLNLRADLVGTGVRVSNVEPGLCGGTEFSHVRFKGDADKAAAVYADTVALSAQDIANVIMWLIEQPPHINVNRIEIMPVTQAPAALQVIRQAAQ